MHIYLGAFICALICMNAYLELLEHFKTFPEKKITKIYITVFTTFITLNNDDQ